MKIDLNAVRAEAERQLIKEKFEAAVSAQKARLRLRKPWWQVIFPFKITIEKLR